MAKPTLLFTVAANELALIKTKRPYYLAKLKTPAEEGQRIIFQTAPIAATEGVPSVEAEEAEFVITNVHQLEGINDKWWVLSVPALDVTAVIDNPLTKTVTDCIKVLQQHILPDSQMSDSEAITQLYGILDNKHIVQNLKDNPVLDRQTPSIN